MSFDITEISKAFALMAQGLSVVKKIKDLLPNSAEKNQATEKLQEAEKAMRLAESKIAQELDYHLCKCTFPPQIMLSIGYQNTVEKFECQQCGKVYPPDIPKEYRYSQDSDTGY